MMKPTHLIPWILRNFRIALLGLFAFLQGFLVVSAQELNRKYNDIVDLVPTPLITTQSSQNSEANYVRIIYLVPADSIEKPEYTMALENAARHLQIWLYNELGQNKTFELHDPVVEVYQTPNEALWYSTNPRGNPFYYFWNNVLQDGYALTGGYHGDFNNIWIFYMDANPGCNQCGGCGWDGRVVISANDLKGLVGYEIDKSCPNVVHSYKSCRYVGGMGHELGHALMLPHPPECEEEYPNCWDHDLMMYGYITYPNAFLNEADKIRLNDSRFIREIDMEGLFYPSSCMELNDICNINIISKKSILCGDSILLEGSYRNTSGIFYDSLLSAAGCDSIIVTYLTVVTPPPELEDEYVSICEGDSVPDLIAVGENIQWYDDVELSNLVHSGDTLKTGHTGEGTFTYYITQTILGIESTPIPVTLTISPVPPLPTAKDTAFCKGRGNNYLLVDGTNITWYSDPELTNPVETGDTLFVSDSSAMGEHIYYVTQIMNKCESLPDTLTFTLNPLPDPPIADDTEICENEPAPVLIANGESIAWYRDTYSTTFIDPRDDQEYKAVRIGNQIWMAENLNYNAPSGSWYYDNDSISYADTYGKLYECVTSWNVCPSGWHLPSGSEWHELFNYSGGLNIAAGKLKQTGDAHWMLPNISAINLYGFTALPAGYKADNTFNNLGAETCFWSTASDWLYRGEGLTFKLTYNSAEIMERWLFAYSDGASVRCVKDNVCEFVGFGDMLATSNTQTGTYTFYITQTISNCTSPFDTVRLTINPIPAAPLVGNVTVSEGEEIPDLSATGENIQWYTDSGLNIRLHSGNSFSTGQTQAGVYTYFLNQSVASCESLADSVNLRIHSLPVIDLGNDTTIYTDQILTLNIGNPEYSYLWSDGSDLPYCKLSGLDLGLGEHMYRVVVSDANSCLNADSIVIAVIDPVNLQFNNARNSIKIYPNPVKDLMFVQTRIPGKHKIMITSIKGEIIYSMDFLGSYKQIDFSSYQKGLYIIKIESEDIVTTEEIIKY